MLRIFAPLVFMALFTGWLLYHWLVRKDLKRHWDSWLPGVFFTGIWLLIYLFLLH